MEHFNFIKQYIKNKNNYNLIDLYIYGSRVYGTYSDNSDYDYYVIINEDKEDQIKIKKENDILNLTIINEKKFNELLKEHNIGAIESVIYSGKNVNIDLIKLRKSVSEKSSNSWVKCKKKLLDAAELLSRNDDLWKETYFIGLKSMFHSLRILNFGIQLAKTKTIKFNDANKYWDLINKDDKIWTFNELESLFKTEYNLLSSEFKKVAPKIKF